MFKKTFGIQKQFLAFILSLGWTHVNYTKFTQLILKRSFLKEFFESKE